MMSTASFIGVVAVLLMSGSCSSACLRGKRRPGLLDISLGLPLAALWSAILTLGWTVISVPLTASTLLLPHAVIVLVACGWMSRSRESAHEEPTVSTVHRSLHWSLRLLASAIIAATGIASFAHAVMLPSFQYDSFTNWTMRSQISWADQSIAFDPTEERGMAKPQYPILFHALQITANAGASSWNDRSANTIHWLLSLSTLFALWLLLRSRMGRDVATVTIGMLCSVPLVALHLWQGYADITLTSQLLLSAVLLETWLRTRARGSLILSACMVSAAVWTKSEGLPFGLLPWIVLAGLPLSRSRESVLAALGRIAPAVLLTAPWPLFAWIRGLGLTPHSSDATLSLHPEAVSEVMRALFSRGSFGIAWYAVIIATITLACTKKRWPAWRTVTWGWISFVGFLLVYTITPNVRFLFNAESFYRQMLSPITLLIVGMALIATGDDGAPEEATLAACTVPSSPKSDLASSQGA